MDFYGAYLADFAYICIEIKNIERYMTKVFCAAAAFFLLTACSTPMRVTDVSGSRILIDNRYDVTGNDEASAFLAPYSATVDSMMSPVVGRTARYMEAHRPESTLSNLLADILLWGGQRFDETLDFAVYNMGGIRAALPEGKITFGDVLDVAPFENKICFLTLTGDDVKVLFEQMAAAGGEGVSRGVNLVISKDGRLISALVGGRELKADAKYRIATLDYLAMGNDGLVAFKKKYDVVSPQATENNVRFIIQDYFRNICRNGTAVDSKVEGRIVIE